MMTLIQQVPDFIEFLGRSDAVLKHFNTMADDIAEINKKTYSDIPLEFKQIRFENLAFQYKANKTLLFQNLNITMNTDGRVIGITGLSGNGKSTLMKLVLKLYRPTEGTIYIDGKDIQNVDADYIRSQITYVNQNSKLFDKKIVDNMLYGCSDLEHCNHYLSIIMKYPKIQELYKNTDIYTKQSGSLGENLSGGQRQVVNMIGGLVNPSKILILDEPTNALDPSLKKELLGLLRDFKQYKQCMIIITHDRDVYPLFDETIQI
jgi:ABC-type bacteriocin/lantibiotic exporter with double-glycine peptidase domain